MNRNTKIQISKAMARRILLELKNENCFDGYISMLYTKAKCISIYSELYGSHMTKEQIIDKIERLNINKTLEILKILFYND